MSVAKQWTSSMWWIQWYTTCIKYRQQRISTSRKVQKVEKKHNSLLHLVSRSMSYFHAKSNIFLATKRSFLLDKWTRSFYAAKLIHPSNSGLWLRYYFWKSFFLLPLNIQFYRKWNAQQKLALQYSTSKCPGNFDKHIILPLHRPNRHTNFSDAI